MFRGGGFYYMFSVSWVQRKVKTRSWVKSVEMASSSSGVV